MIKVAQVFNKYKRSASLQQHLFLSSAILFVILVFGIWGVLYPVTVKTMTERFEDRFNFDADKRVADLNQTFYMVDSFISGITHNSIFKDLVNPNKPIEAYDIYAYRESLNNAIAMNTFIEGVFVYFERDDLIISNFGLSESYDLFVKSNFQFKNYTLEEFKSLFLEGDYNHIILDELVYGQKSNQVIMFMTRPIVNQHVSQHARIGIIVNFDALNEKYNYDNEHPSTFIVYSDKDLIHSKSNHNLTLEEIENMKLMPTDQGFKPMDIAGNEVFVRHNQVIYGLDSLIINEKDPALVLIQKTQRILNLIVIVIVLLGLIGIYFNITRSIKPIKRIKHTLKSVGEVFSDSDVDELRWIESNIEHIVEKEHELMRHFKTSTHSLRNFYLSRLIIGPHVDTDQISFGLKLSNVEFIYRYFFCTVIESDVDKETIKNHLKSVIHQVRGLKVYDLYFQGHRRTILIMNCETSLIRNEINESIQKALGSAMCRIGVGGIKENLYDLYISFQEGEKTLNYAYVDKKTSLVYYEDIKDCLPMQILLSKDEEIYLSNYLLAADLKQAKDIVTNHIEKVTNNKAVLVHSIKHLYIQMILVGLRSLKHQNNQIRELYPVNRIYELESHDQLMTYLCAFFSEIVIHNAQFNQENNNECMKHQVIDFIEGHYLNPDLSLTMLADYVGVHRVYLCKYFKEKFDIGFVEYVNRKRIERALFLLKDSGVSIGDIVVQSGFNSEVTFRREFKRYNGISPSQYRGQVSDS